MSRKITKEIACPHCNASVDTELWSSINVTHDPAARVRIMDESLFSWRCPECGYQAKLLYPCLYHDMDRKFMIYLIPELTQNSLFDPLVEKQFPELADIRKRLVTDLNAMKEKVLLFEAGLDDKAIELTKLALSEVLAKRRGQAVLYGYFCAYDGEQNRLGFSFFLEGDSEPCYQGTRMQVYEKSMEIVNRFAPAERDGAGFIRIDGAWASEILRQYRSEL